MTTIEICQKSLTHELVVKAVIDYLGQIMSEHTNYVTTINSLNTISYFALSSETIYVPSPMRLLCLVNGQTCEFCLIHPLDSLHNFFGIFVYPTCLGYESQANHIQVCDWKRRPFFSQRRTWSQIFDHINTTFLQVTDDVLF